MATLIPDFNSCSSRMTSGERRLAQRLKSHLETDYLLWYDIPIGPRCRRPDFVLLHPNRALFALPPETSQSTLRGIRLTLKKSTSFCTKPLIEADLGLI